MISMRSLKNWEKELRARIKIFSVTILSEANFRMVEKIFLGSEERVFQRSLHRIS
jgi:hypothetical protein